MSLLKKIKISTKIFGGFGMVLVLLMAIAVTGGLNLYNGNEQFTRYRQIALQTNQAGRVQANLLEARLAVKNFVIHASDANIAKVQKRTNKTLVFNKQLDAMMNSAAKKAVASKADKNLNIYLQAFNKVTVLQAKRNDLVTNKLDKVGPQIERKLTAIMQSAFKDKDAESAFLAGTVQRNLLLMRLYAVKFLVTNEEAAYQRVLKEASEMAENQKKCLLVWKIQDVVNWQQMVSSSQKYIARLLAV